MRKLSGIAIAVAVILASAVLTGATPVTPIPFKAYDEVSAALVDGGPAGKCSEKLAFAYTLEKQGVRYSFYVLDGRFILIDAREGNDTPVWIGRTEAEHLVVTQVTTWEGLLKLAPVPGSPDGFAACDILNPVTAKGV